MEVNGKVAGAWGVSVIGRMLGSGCGRVLSWDVRYEGQQIGLSEVASWSHIQFSCSSWLECRFWIGCFPQKLGVTRLNAVSHVKSVRRDRLEYKRNARKRSSSSRRAEPRYATSRCHTEPRTPRRTAATTACVGGGPSSQE